MLFWDGFFFSFSPSPFDSQSIPEEVKLYSKAGEDIRQASFHRIVVSTCSSAAMFHNVSLQ